MIYLHLSQYKKKTLLEENERFLKQKKEHT